MGEVVVIMQEKIPELHLEDITDDIAIFKINNSSYPNISKEHLYDVTRGCWKVSLKRVEPVQYALSVFRGTVVAVYTIKGWYTPEEEKRVTIPYDYDMDHGRFIFKGVDAPEDIAKKYIGKSVKGLFKRGDRHPVKVIMGKSFQRC